MVLFYFVFLLLSFSICRFHSPAAGEVTNQDPCTESKHNHALKCFKCFACPSCKTQNQRQLKAISSPTPFISRFLSASPRVRTVRTVGKGPSSSAGGPVNGTVVRTAEEKTAEYAVFALVPIFCVMGLLGILICNILKKKGYRCSADKEGGDEETATPQKEGRRKLGELE